ncbi:uncharacterized protein LOC136092325 isoform X2 [Hydra vulgaris]|uniref:Uncharacterized protein LOC136092325 isoform X2 n=1 Tax=Hydra vulgaris TaxID=6087 RepID=A0ABM4DP59_HYDVU
MDVAMKSSDLSDYDDITDTSIDESEDFINVQVSEKNTTYICNSIEEASQCLVLDNEQNSILDNMCIYICDSVEEADLCLQNYEIYNSVRYAAFSTPKNFGNTDMHADKHKVLWEISSDFYKTPYIVLSIKRFDCHHGFDRNSSKKQKYVKAKESQVAILTI